MKILYDTIFLLLLLLAFSFQQPMTIAMSYGLCGIYAAIGFSQRFISVSKIATLLAIIIFPSLVALKLNQGVASAFYLFSLPLVVLAAQVFAGRPHQHIISCLQNLFWIFVLAIFIGLALHWNEPEPLGAIFPGTSTNGLPSYLIVVQIAYSIAYYLKHNRLPLLSSLATLIVAVFGLGRGSMIIAGLIVAFSVLVNALATESKTERRIFFLLGAIVVPTLIFYVFTYQSQITALFNTALESSKFSGGVIDEHRARMISDYFQKIDVWALFLGADYRGTSIAHIYGGNPHNSFIRLHSFYGLPGLLLVFSSLMLLIVSNRRLKHKIVTLAFIAFALLRAITEPIFFPSTLDFFYIFYLIIYFNYAEKSHHSQLQKPGYAPIHNIEAN